MDEEPPWMETIDSGQQKSGKEKGLKEEMGRWKSSKVRLCQLGRGAPSGW